MKLYRVSLSLPLFLAPFFLIFYNLKKPVIWDRSFSGASRKSFSLENTRLRSQDSLNCVVSPKGINHITILEKDKLKNFLFENYIKVIKFCVNFSKNVLMLPLFSSSRLNLEMNNICYQQQTSIVNSVYIQTFFHHHIFWKFLKYIGFLSASLRFLKI